MLSKRFAIFPISVFIPILSISKIPLPFNTVVPINPWFFPFFESLETPTDSPVKSDSSIIIPELSINVPSAGILSPASNIIRSPIVTSIEFITFKTPSLITLQVGAANSFNASKDFSVLYSCTNPIIAFTTTIISIVIASAVSPIKPEITVAAINTQTIKSLN
ncbi:hypothetical protein SDC9_46187 [bioreactor metagenome]|uniref:Uncharacterized protein n=1 Tax=bioreactor metagenome TaxID=1076179 RepID=A0A644W845_9ZZZZ